MSTWRTQQKEVEGETVEPKTWRGRSVSVRQALPMILRRRTLGSIGHETVDLETIDVNPSQASPRTGKKFSPWMITFLTLVVLPFLLGSLYFIFIASDQFTAEARFAVRSLADDTANEGPEGGSLLAMRSAGQDAYVVTSFIHSAEILKRLKQKIDYRAIFSRNNIDFLSSFSIGGANEDFLDYWKQQITAYIDGPSGIVTLKVRTFSPEDSVTLASAIVEESEILINEMSVRARNDVLASVRAEVEKAGAVYVNSLGELNQFQNASGILSPQIQAQETGKLVAKLLGEKLEIETRQFVAKQSSADRSPAYQQLTLARESIDGQIERLKAELTGTENESLAKALLRYSELETNRLLAEKIYEASRQVYEATLAESLRKALYVVVFVQPTLPEKSLYPLRFFSPLVIFLGLSVLWSTLALAWASIQDHRL